MAPISTNKITVDELARRLRSGEKIQLIDVRDTDEFRKQHISGSVNMPMRTWVEKTADLIGAIPVILICTDGKKAETVGSLMNSRGFTDVCTVAGGILAWKVQGLPLEGFAVRS